MLAKSLSREDEFRASKRNADTSQRDIALLLEIAKSLRNATQSEKARDVSTRLEGLVEKLGKASRSANEQVQQIANDTRKSAASAARRVLTAARVAEAQSAPYTTPAQRKSQRNKALYKAVTAATSACVRATQRFRAPKGATRGSKKGKDLNGAVGGGVNAVRARKGSNSSYKRPMTASTFGPEVDSNPPTSRDGSAAKAMPSGDKKDKKMFRMLERVIKDKITQHTRSDNDRMRKVHEVFNTFRVDVGALHRGLNRWGIPIAKSESERYFRHLCETCKVPGNPGQDSQQQYISVKAMVAKLFPQSNDYREKSYFDLSEEAGQKKMVAAWTQFRKEGPVGPQVQWPPEKIMELMKQKIMQYTRSDEDRIRKLFSMFNDGHSHGAAAGIDPEEFHWGLIHHFGLNVPRSSADKLFAMIDVDKDRNIDTKELCGSLFPQSGDYSRKSWYIKSEEAAVRKIQEKKPGQRRASALVGPPVRGWNQHMLVRSIKEKIMNHTRADTDRMRMLFQMFNDNAAGDGGDEHGIDKLEFYKGLRDRFGLNAPRTLTDGLFDRMDKDGTGHMEIKELSDYLFPQTADYTEKSWYIKSEEEAVDKLQETAKSLRRKNSSGVCEGAAPRANFSIPQMENLIRDKIIQHTRSDEDRMRKLFTIFNDGDGGSHGIDKNEFYQGVAFRFGINAPRLRSDGLFDRIDKDGSGHIEIKELSDYLFPQTADYTQKSWYIKSEEEAVRKLNQTKRSLRKQGAAVMNGVSDVISTSSGRESVGTERTDRFEIESVGAGSIGSGMAIQGNAIKGNEMRFSSPWQI